MVAQAQAIALDIMFMQGWSIALLWRTIKHATNTKQMYTCRSNLP